MNLQICSLTPMAFIALIALAPPAAAGDSLLSSPIELAQSAPPPREAFEACASKAEDEACAFSLQDGTAIEGTCRQPPRGRDDAMVCVPSGADG